MKSKMADDDKITVVKECSIGGRVGMLETTRYPAGDPSMTRRTLFKTAIAAALAPVVGKEEANVR